jgi:hypothetical protein
MAGHLMWSRGGTVWATWRVQPLAYGFRPDKDKHSARAAHQALLRSLPGEAVLLGTCAALDPATVVSRMIEGIPLEHCPEWADECEATLETLDELALGQRTFWLSVPLKDHGRLGGRLFGRAIPAEDCEIGARVRPLFADHPGDTSGDDSGDGHGGWTELCFEIER